MLNLKQVETFLWIARLGSFASAADRINSTQSTISARIHELEYTLGATLFDRTKRTVQLTPKGLELLPLAEQLVAMAVDIESAISAPELMTGRIRIGVADLIAITWLGQLVAAVREEFPSVILEVDIGLTADLISKLRDRKLDLALVPADTALSEFDNLPLGSVDFAWMASPSMALPNANVTPAILEDSAVVTLSDQSFHHHTVNRWFLQGGARCKRTITCNSIGVLISLVLDGIGVGLLPMSCVKPMIEAGQLQTLKTDPKTEAVAFYAFLAPGMSSALVSRIAEIAAEAATFGEVVPGTLEPVG